MTVETLTTKIDPAKVGAFITENLYLDLVQNFRVKFPTEKRFVDLSRSALETV